MNYKNFIKSRRLRVLMLTFFSWVPDSIMLRIQYRMQTGRKLNLKNPKRFTEKLQLYKMKYRNPVMLRCTDKYEVRKYIEEKGFGEYLIPLIGVYSTVEEIDYAKLPNSFVAKSTDGSGGNQVLICKNKETLSENNFREQLYEWMHARKVKKQAGREWAYENDYPRRIIIEELLFPEDSKLGLLEYKFLCFNGKVSFVEGLSERVLGKSVLLGFYDKNFNKLNVKRTDVKTQEKPLQKPINYDVMLKIAECLSKDFPHLRVDTYNINGKIYIGELTFYDASGYRVFNPDSFDYELGRDFDISSFK